MSRTPLLNVDQQASVHQLAAEGFTRAAIAQRFDVSPSAVGRVLCGTNVGRADKYLGEQKVFEVLCGFQNFEAGELAEQYGCSEVTVYDIWTTRSNIAAKVWADRKSNVQDEWTRRGAPNWRVA